MGWVAPTAFSSPKRRRDEAQGLIPTPVASGVLPLLCSAGTTKQCARRTTSTERGSEPFPTTFFRYGVDYPATVARRDSYAGYRGHLFWMACSGSASPSTPHAGPRCSAPGRLPFPPSPGHGLLLHSSAQPFPAAL